MKTSLLGSKHKIAKRRHGSKKQNVLGGGGGQAMRMRMRDCDLNSAAMLAARRISDSRSFKKKIGRPSTIQQSIVFPVSDKT